ncbi:MAG: FGGY-family carbohydrate kinase [Eubacteriales bacterium]|nr:FGGY-family carbohydrate kinase [Eubacteriales bacterium]
MNERIRQCEPGADGLLFLPHLLGERAPRWNPGAKGVFFGITATTSREQMLRSVMEGIIMNLGICFDILRKETPAKELRLIGGAARSSQWQKGIADIFQVPVLVPKYLEEANSIGAAVIAGVGSGVFRDFSAVDQFVTITNRVEPSVETKEVYDALKLQYDAVYKALEPIFTNYMENR